MTRFGLVPIAAGLLFVAARPARAEDAPPAAPAVSAEASPTPALTATPEAVATPSAVPTETEAAEPPPLPLRERSTFDDGQRDGRADGQATRPKGWAEAGLGGGIVLGPVGCAGVTAWSFQKPADSCSPPADGGASPTPEYIRGYGEGYGATARRRRTNYAVTGGFVGTLMFATIVLIVVQSRDAKKSATVEPLFRF